MYQASRQRKNKGFTLVELMFSMVFISLLIIAITMTIMQILSLYNKGLLMKEVNQTGRTVTDQMQRTISSSVPSAAVNTVVMTNPANTSEKTGGRFCLSNYSYVWNYAKSLKTTVSTPNVYSTGSPANEKVRFVRVPDAGGSYCQLDASGKYKQVVRADAVEMLSTSSYSLVLHDLSVVSGANNFDAASNQRLYYIDVVVGTNDYKAIDVSSGRSCKPPSEGDSDQDYCAINGFSFVARAGNR